MEITRPLFDSSGIASVFGSFTSTPPCMIGAVIMKITMSSIITSISETTLISALSGVRSPRERRRMLDPPLSRHQCDHLRSEAVELAVEAVELRRENVIPEHGGNGDGERDRRGGQRLRDAGRHRTEVSGAALGDAKERRDDAEHRAEQAHERARRADDREAGDRAAELVALGIRLGVEQEAERFDLRAAERPAGAAAVGPEGRRVVQELDRAGEHAGVRARLDALRERDDLFQSRGFRELGEEGVAGVVHAAEFEPLREHDSPTDQREAGEEDQYALRDVARALDELDGGAGDGGAGLGREQHDGGSKMEDRRWKTEISRVY